MHRTRTWNMDQPVLRGRNRVLPMEGGDGSTLSLDFTTMSGLDSRFTFTRASTATYINSIGLVTTMAAASTNDPTKARFDYDPTTLAPRGLLIEGSATNFVTQSSAMNNWTFTRATASTPSVTAPNGASTSVLATGTADVNNHLVQNPNSISFTPQNYTFSVWLKAGATNFAQLSLTNALGFPTNTYVNVNLSNGTLGTLGGTGATATISTAYPNGWYRVTLTANQTSTASHTGSCLIYLVSSATAARAESWDASSASVYVFGAQLEAGSGASSYIPTGASTEQRAAESCSIAASSSWLNTASGTFLVNWHRGDRGGTERSAFSSDYVAGRLLQLNNTDISTSVSLIWWNGNIFRTTGTAINKAAYTYGQTTGSGATLQLPVRLCVNGSAVATGTFGNGTTTGADVPNPVNWTNFVIGAAASSAPYTTATRDWLNNCVRSIKYWPTVLPDATLQSLTQ